MNKRPLSIYFSKNSIPKNATLEDDGKQYTKIENSDNTETTVRYGATEDSEEKSRENPMSLGFWLAVPTKDSCNAVQATLTSAPCAFTF